MKNKTRKSLGGETDPSKRLRSMDTSSTLETSVVLGEVLGEQLVILSNPVTFSTLQTITNPKFDKIREKVRTFAKMNAERQFTGEF